MATGIKRAFPEAIVFTYQGDGDLAAIGTAETIHAANRGENITTIFINNAVYGMTGGQMAPTTLLGQKTTTTPYGRDGILEGYPIKMSEMLALVKGTAYIERVAVNSPANIRKDQKSHPEGLPDADRQARLFHGGDTLSLSHQLEDDSLGGLAVDRRGDEQGVPAGSDKGHNGEQRC